MTNILDNFALLDPDREMRLIDEALSSNIRDQWSLNDHGLFKRRFEVLKPNVLTNYSDLDSFLEWQKINASLSEGGGGDTIPAWAAALRGLVSDPDDLLFAYNFASGGTGEGWDGTNNRLLTVSESWTDVPWDVAFDPTKIIDGLGLSQGNGADAVTPEGLLPSLPNGATLLIEGRTYAPVTTSTRAAMYNHLVDLPDDNGEGGANLTWLTVDDDTGGPDETNSTADFTNVNGIPGDVDVIVKAQRMRAVTNYTLDGSDIVGSLNGRANVTGSGAVRATPANACTIINRSRTSDVLVYLNIVAVFVLQNGAAPPSMSSVV